MYGLCLVVSSLLALYLAIKASDVLGKVGTNIDAYFEFHPVVNMLTFILGMIILTAIIYVVFWLATDLQLYVFNYPHEFLHLHDVLWEQFNASN